MIKVRVREENFAENVVEEYEFDICREVGVDTVLTEEFVMFDMVFLIGSTCQHGASQ